MSDFISKKRLKWEVEKWYEKEYYSSFNATVYKTLIKIIDKFPSVEPERKVGHWEDCSNGWMCSECKHDVTYTTKYCPNCGAKMIDEQALKYADNDTAKSGLQSAT